MAYEDFKDLARRTTSDKFLRDKTFNIVKNPKYDGYQRELASMVYKCSDEKLEGKGVNTNTSANDKIKQNQSLLGLAARQLAEELHKPIIIKIKKRTVYSRYRDNIWGTILADMQLISKFNKGVCFLLCVIDIFRKYAWVVHLKYKKGVSISDTFQKILDDSKKTKQNMGRQRKRILQKFF